MKNKIIEYQDAPSGQINLYNYKEPFMEFVDKATGKGFGYEGVLILDAEGDVLQCHLCGEWFNSLQHHIRKEHNVSAKLYKEKVGLNQSTALISENYRLKLIERKQLNGTLGLNLRPGTKHTEESKNKIRETLKKRTRQTENIWGTCPLQLKERFWALKEKLGRQPVSKDKEIKSSLSAIKRVYGSWNNFVAECGGENQNGTEWRVKLASKKTEEIINCVIQKGLKLNNKTLKQEFGYSVAKASREMQKIKKQKIYYKTMQQKFRQAELRQDREERLKQLKNFYEVNKRLPSGSDFRRKLIGGSASWYYYHFKTLKKALTEALK